MTSCGLSSCCEGSSSPFTFHNKGDSSLTSEYLLCRSLLSFYSAHITPCGTHPKPIFLVSSPYALMLRHSLNNPSLSHHHYNKFLKFPQPWGNYPKTELDLMGVKLVKSMYVGTTGAQRFLDSQDFPVTFSIHLRMWGPAWIPILAPWKTSPAIKESSFLGSCFHIEDYYHTPIFV